MMFIIVGPETPGTSVFMLGREDFGTFAITYLFLAAFITLSMAPVISSTLGRFPLMSFPFTIRTAFDSRMVPISLR